MDRYWEVDAMTKPVKSLIERFLDKLEFAGKSSNTISTYGLRLRKLNDWLAENHDAPIDTASGIAKVKGAMLEDWQYSLRESGKGQAAEHSYVAAAKSFFKWALDAGYINTDPSRALTAVKVVSKEQVHLEWSQVEHLFQAYRSRNEILDLCILGIGFTMGLRNSAICGLNIGDFTGTKLTYTNKGGRRVTAYVPEFIAELIKKYIAEFRSGASADEPLFVNIRKNRFSRRDLLRMCHKAGKFIGVPELTAHAMRRSCLTRVSELQGIELAQSLANHSSSYTTERYVYQSQNNMEKLYEDMNILNFDDEEGE